MPEQTSFGTQERACDALLAGATRISPCTRFPKGRTISEQNKPSSVEHYNQEEREKKILELSSRFAAERLPFCHTSLCCLAHRAGIYDNNATQRSTKCTATESAIRPTALIKLVLG
mmetsp:Transcript_7987/g.19998  ORF Transcript_7987/g.19998 Transcript_7987/m.19998 type:complete len:116 (-) Transcript_7987:62-409(-)